jgi:rare lipoprotein A
MLKKIIISLLACSLFLLTGCVERTNATTTLPNQIKKSTKGLYQQNGKHYQVMKTSNHYEEKGVASWYGRKFNKKRTSSGERFNMYRMTAAHKTLPLSTYVKVTNLTNGKHVIVKVNDRGPFISNRLIDLSYAAAKKLGMVNRGTVPVNIKVVRA